MLFNSLPFLIFLPSVVLLYYLLPSRSRWMLLLAASYFFYGFWKIEYLSLIIISTTVDYFAARYIHEQSSQLKKRIGLGVSLLTNLGLLAFFKYSGWFMEDVLFETSVIDSETLNSFNSFWDFALPVGISFYTFQTLGYTIDIYHGRVEPERNPLKFALFVSYFPQLVAGPIERFSHLHKQLFQDVKFDYRNLQKGGRTILYGLFIKMCVADNVSPIVDQIFANVEGARSLQLIIGMLLFGLQIYSDFHGYSLIAIGSARILGVELMDNFRAPYLSTSIREFWSRWHISLSTWFRDYLYIPMGGSKVGRTKLMINILVVFLVSGLWHGANWTFVIWGAMHGLAYLLERWFISRDTARWLDLFKWGSTMLIVFVAWIFFRSPSLTHASLYITEMIGGEGTGIDLDWEPYVASIAGIFILSDIRLRNTSFDQWIDERSVYARWTVYGLLLFFILGFAGTVRHPFIYFQF